MQGVSKNSLLDTGPLSLPQGSFHSILPTHVLHLVAYILSFLVLLILHLSLTGAAYPSLSPQYSRSIKFLVPMDPTHLPI